MVSVVKRLLMWLLRIPPEPSDPLGEEGSLRVFRAAPGYFTLKLVTWLLQRAIILGAALALVVLEDLYLPREQLARQPPLETVIRIFEIAALVFVLLQTLLSGLTLRLDYELRWYKVSDRSLRIREGIAVVRELTMTFANIQNISISQGPLQRLFRIADLKVESAGGGGAEARQRHPLQVDMHTAYFRGVDNAEEIRTLMLGRLRGRRDAGLGDDAPRARTPAAAWSAAGPRAGGTDGAAAALLAEVRDEARGLRAAAERLAG